MVSHRDIPSRLKTDHPQHESLLSQPITRHADDNRSIGIILCKSKNKIVAEYSLRDTNKPIGVSSYQLGESLPESLKGSLPSIEELESGIDIIQIRSSKSARDTMDC